VGVGTAPPEPWASRTDLLSASQALERAIHAASGPDAARALAEAAAQLLHARDYWRTYGDVTHAGQAESVAAVLRGWAQAAAALRGHALHGWQESVLYRQGQGMLAWLDWVWR
jgi:hypothetical protein